MYIPNYAQKVAEKYIPEKNATLKVYKYLASKGYQSNFKPIEHLAIRVVNNETQKRLIDKITTSKKTMKQWEQHWRNQFNLHI